MRMVHDICDGGDGGAHGHADFDGMFSFDACHHAVPQVCVCVCVCLCVWFGCDV